MLVISSLLVILFFVMMLVLRTMKNQSIMSILCIICSLEDLKASITQKIFPLHSETTILPGHGEFTSVSSEVLYNKVVGKAAGKK